MSAPLWAKRDHQGEPAGSGGGHDDELRRFMAGDDVQLDGRKKKRWGKKG